LKRLLTLGATSVAIILGLGFTLYILTAPGAPAGNLTSSSSTQTTSSSSTQTTSQGGQNIPPATGYACSKPAINSQNFCDQLPAGYQIAPRLPAGPAAYCRAGMTDSVCALLKQTFANGVCDPNETVWTDPLDCGCTGAVVGDPFTGRCGSPATVCQLQALQEDQAAYNKG